MNQLQYKDSTGQEWNLAISYRTAKRVDAANFESLTDEVVSMTEPSSELLGLWMTKVGLVIGTCWVICETQAEELGVSETEWEERLGGDALVEMQEAFWRACADFFPRSRIVLTEYADCLASNKTDQENMMRKLAAKVRESREKMIAEAEVLLNEMNDTPEKVGTPS